MGDLSEEYWEVEDYSRSYESDSKLGWVWRKGLCLGKKMVVTGVVVSSAPFVLPPLVALSAIGFAFSVPAGFVFATYACGEKLMDCLLPMPSLPSPPEKGIEWTYEEGADFEAEEREFEDDIRKEVETRIELVDEGGDSGPILTNIDEFDRKMGVNEIVEEDGYEEDIGEHLEDEEQPLNSTVIPYILEGIREAEDEISLTERERDEMPIDSLKAVVVSAEVGGENEDNVGGVMKNLAFVGQQDVKEEKGNKDNFTDIDEEEMRRETTGLIEELRDEGRHEKEDEVEVEIPVKDTTQNKGTRNLFVIPEEVKSGEDVGAQTVEISDYITDREPKGDESLFVEVEPEPVVENKLVVQVKATTNGHTTTDVRQETGSNRDTGALVLSNADEREMEDESGLDVIDQGTLAPKYIADSLDKKSEGKEPPSIDEGVNVIYHEVSVESTIPVSGRAEGASSQATAWKEPPSNDAAGVNIDYHEVSVESTTPVSEHVDTVSSQDAAGKDSPANDTVDHFHDVLVESTIPPTKHAGTVSLQDTLGNETPSNDAVGANVDYHEVYVGSSIPVSKPAPLQDILGREPPSNEVLHVSVDYLEVPADSTISISKHAGTASSQAAAARPDKVSINEEKIWEQIHAMRTIVGYREALQSSYVEELKALYVFTGVEPPASSKDPADLDEKLHFLMSVIGVK